MAKKILTGKDNTNGFQKNPENINRNGANGRSVTKCLKELLNDNIANVEIILTNEKGLKKIKKFQLQTKSDFNELLSILLLQKAISGDLQAIREILDRTEGKPLQKTENSIDLTPKLNIIVNNDEITNEIDKLTNDNE